MTTAAERWQEMVRERLAAMFVLGPEQDGIDPSFWSGRADRYARRVAGTVEHDPLLPRVRRAVDADTVVLDVGAGTGRFALALAGDVREVVALDPSDQMLRVLTEHAAGRGVTNVRTVCGRLDEHGDLRGDVVLCAHVLPLVPDAARFLSRLDGAARRQVFVCMGAGAADLRTEPLWRHFHGRSRPPTPSYLEAIAVLGELGIRPEVEVVEAPASSPYASLDEAVEDHVDLLRLDSVEDVRPELRRVLETWLVRTADGAWRAPVPVLPVAILSWSPR